MIGSRSGHTQEVEEEVEKRLSSGGEGGGGGSGGGVCRIRVTGGMLLCCRGRRADTGANTLLEGIATVEDPCYPRQGGHVE